MKKLMLGNDAVARGLYEAGVTVVSSYPGTPSTEITECVAKYEEIKSEWAPNEKVACEVAVGASIAGARSFTAMKHVGLNVAADPVFTYSYIGVNGGMVLAVADDSGMHSSQNEQDSRHYAMGAKIPMLEPTNSQECKEFTRLAFEISEEFDTPVIVRLSTRISHSQSIVDTREREEVGVKPYVKNIAKNVMMPAFARPKHVMVEERTAKLAEYAEKCEFNTVEYFDKKIGVIANGPAYQYAREALGENASYLKLGMVYPLPLEIIKDFAKECETVYVLEELDDITETHCRKNGINVIGKDVFSVIGEYSQSIIAEKILGKKVETKTFGEVVPPRPPVMCAGCPHRGLFYVLAKNDIRVSGDIGCYTLGGVAPLNSMDTTVCMGCSISGLHGINKADPENEKKWVAVIGDSTFMHSGVTGLINIAYNSTNSTVIILDNSITGMTGHQHNPTTGFTLKGDPAAKIDLEKLCKAVGIDRVVTCDPYNLVETEKVIKEELAADAPSVIIARRPCVLLKTVKHEPALNICGEKCIGCKKCLKVGCPAISMEDKKAKIDVTQCTGCGICEGLCPVKAIEGGKKV